MTLFSEQARVNVKFPMSNAWIQNA